MDKSDSKPERLSWITDKTFLAFFGAIFALILIILVTVINVATQVEDIEEKLSYKPPENSTHSGQQSSSHMTKDPNPSERQILSVE